MSLLKQILLLSLIVVGFTSTLYASPEVPGPKQTTPIAIVGGTIHTVSGKTFVGTLQCERGNISAIGAKVALPQKTLRIDAKGKHVYPGLIESYSQMGLIEINAVRSTRDTRETGHLNPNARAQVAFNPDSELIPVNRAGGVLLCASVPQGGLVSGTSALMQMDGWTWEEMTLRSDLGMHIDWPSMNAQDAWWEEKSGKEQLSERDENLKQLDKLFDEARAYQVARRAAPGRNPRDARLDAMLPVLERKLPLIVSANEIQQIQSAVSFAVRQKAKLIIYGGFDAPLCAPLLKRHKVPVIIGSVHRSPRRRSDPYDSPYTLAARLHKLGVKFCISSSGRFGASNVRNLPNHAGTAVAYGLAMDQALRAITLSVAEILGVEQQVGSLDIGKHATLLITDGNILESTTHVEAAFIQGRKVDLNSRHTRLWKKYQQKYKQLEASGE